MWNVQHISYVHMLTDVTFRSIYALTCYAIYTCEFYVMCILIYAVITLLAPGFSLPSLWF